MAYTLSDQTPGFGYISWSNVNISFDGTANVITNGSTNKKYVTWRSATPTVLEVSDEYPTLGDNDCLVFINTRGIGLSVLDSDVIDGSIVVPGSITAKSLAVGCVSAEHIAAGAIKAESIDAFAITGDHLSVNAIEAQHITAGAIEADHLTAGSVVAGKVAAGAIGANEIAANSIVAGNIAADAITTDKIAANAVTAAEIAANTITASQIASDTITAAQIAAGAIGATEIAAGAIRTDKLLVTGQGSALNSDPMCSDASAWSWAAVPTMITGITDLPIGSTAITNTAGTYQIFIGSEHIPVDPTRNYRVEALIKQVVGTLGTHSLGVVWYDSAKSLIANPTVAGWVNGTYSYFPNCVNQVCPTTWTKYGTSFGPNETCKIPATAKFVTLVTLHNPNSTAGSQTYCSSFRLWQKADADLIVDGSITTNKMTAGTIDGDRIQAGTLDADRITANSITSGQIAAGAITADELAAGSVFAKHITIANFDNLVPNPNSEMANPDATYEGQGVTATNPYAGTKCRVVPPSTQLYLTPKIPVLLGEEYYCEAMMRLASMGAAQIVIVGYDAAGTYLGNVFLSSGTPSTTYAKYGGSFTIGSVASTPVAFITYCIYAAAATTAYFDNLYMRRRADANLIVDGSISAIKIAANTITGDQIAANSIYAKNLTLTNFSNLVPNPSNANIGTAGSHERNGLELVAGIWEPSGYARVINATGAAAQYVILGGDIPVVPGEQYYVECRVTAQAGLNAGNLGFGFYKTAVWDWADYALIAGNTISTTLATPTKISKAITIPAGCYGVTPLIHAWSQVSGKKIYFGDMVIRKMADASLIVDGTITATKMVAGTITAASAIIADAAIVNAKIANLAVDNAKIADLAITNAKINDLNASKITAGYIDAARINAGTITTSHLNFTPITGANAVATINASTEGIAINANRLTLNGGGAINRDPGIMDPTVWGTSGAGGFDIFTVTDCPAGNKTIRNSVISTAAYVQDNAFYPVDTSKTYRVRFWARSYTTPAVMYMDLRQYTDNAGATCATNGGRAPYKPNAVTVPTTWTEYSNQWGAADWQSGVKFVRLDWLLNYNGAATYMEICNPRFEEMSGAELIVDGAISASKIAANTITANEIAANAITASELSANAVTATHILAGAVTTNKLVVTGQGKALNDDPNFTDSTAWVISGSGQFVNYSVDQTIPAGLNKVRITNATQISSSRTFSIDPSKTYKVSLWAKQVSGGGGLYVRLYCYSAADVLQSYYCTGQSINGVPFSTSMENMTVPGTWTKYVGFILPGSGIRALPLLHINWSTTGVTDICDFRVEEYIDADLIVDGAITANKIKAGSITTDKLTVGTVTRQNLLVNGHFGSYNSYGDKTTGWTCYSPFQGAIGTYVVNGKTYSVACFNDNPGGGKVMVAQTVSVTPGRSYTLVGLLYASQGTSGMRVWEGSGSLATVQAGTNIPAMYTAGTFITGGGQQSDVHNRWNLFAMRVTPATTSVVIELVSWATGSTNIYPAFIQFYDDDTAEATASLDIVTQMQNITHGGDVQGGYTSLSVRGLQGRTVSSAAPSTAYALAWDGSQWAPRSRVNDSAALGGIDSSGFPYDATYGTRNDWSIRAPRSGFYEASTGTHTGLPVATGTSGYMHVINCQHSNGANNFALQITTAFGTGGGNGFSDLFWRATDNDGTRAWRTVWDTGNFDPATKANLSAAAFTGAVTAPSFSGVHLKMTTDTTPSVVMNSDGAKYGQIGRISTQRWGLGYGDGVAGATTAQLSWGVDVGVTVTGTLSVNPTGGGPGTTTTSGPGVWAYNRLNNGSQLWDIATNSSLSGTQAANALGFRPGGGDPALYLNYDKTAVFASSVTMGGLSATTGSFSGQVTSNGYNVLTPATISSYLTAGVFGINGTPAQYLITTTIPYSQWGMYLVCLDVFEFDDTTPGTLQIGWYVQNNPGRWVVSSAGALANNFDPGTITISKNASNFITIHLSRGDYYRRFAIRAYESGAPLSSLIGWTVSDAVSPVWADNTTAAVRTVVTSATIGAQSVNYAVSAGSATNSSMLMNSGPNCQGIITSNGASSTNLHLDSCEGGNSIYLNYYGGTGGTYFGNGANGTPASVSGTGLGTFVGVSSSATITAPTHAVTSSNTSLSTSGLNVNADTGAGVRFWNGAVDYSISMAGVGAADWGDEGVGTNNGTGYNMVFRMDSSDTRTSGDYTKRGFLFRNNGNPNNSQAFAQLLPFGNYTYYGGMLCLRDCGNNKWYGIYFNNGAMCAKEML